MNRMCLMIRRMFFFVHAVQKSAKKKLCDMPSLEKHTATCPVAEYGL